MAYDTWEAARLVSWSNKQAGIGPLSEAELTRWIDDGVGGLDWEDIWEEDGEETRYIDFPTLISLRMICLLRSQGVSSKEIGEAASLSRKKLGLNWPFASRSIWNLFSESERNPISIYGEVITRIVVARLIHITSIAPSWGSLEFDRDGISCAWFPVQGVVIDPRVVSGSPCVTGTRTPTWVFSGMLHDKGQKSEDRIEQLANGYRLTKELVQNALEWERQLDAASA